MSYFLRLVRQSGLGIRRGVLRPGSGHAIAPGVRGGETGEDVVEIERSATVAPQAPAAASLEWREARIGADAARIPSEERRPETSVSPLQPGPIPASPDRSESSVDEVRLERESAVPVAPAPRTDSAAGRDGADAAELLQRVMNWIAAGSRPPAGPEVDHVADSASDSAESDRSSPIPRTLPQAASEPAPASPPAATVSGSAAADEEPGDVGQQRGDGDAHAGPLVVELPALQVDSRPDPVRRSPPPATEDVVNLTIGTISVRVDAPSQLRRTPHDASPVASREGAGRRLASSPPHAGSRLLRRYIRP